MLPSITPPALHTALACQRCCSNVRMLLIDFILEKDLILEKDFIQEKDFILKKVTSRCSAGKLLCACDFALQPGCAPAVQIA
jgi:hypothetical protein